MTFASVATEWPATQQGLVLCGQPMRFDTSLGANHGARSPMRCGPTKRRRGTRNSEHGFRSVRSAPSASCARRDSFSFWSVTEQGENERMNDGQGHPPANQPQTRTNGGGSSEEERVLGVGPGAAAGHARQRRARPFVRRQNRSYAASTGPRINFP